MPSHIAHRGDDAADTESPLHAANHLVQRDAPPAGAFVSYPGVHYAGTTTDQSLLLQDNKFRKNV